MVNEELRDLIAEVNEEAVLFDNPSFDNSIIGLDTDGRVVYLMPLMIKELMSEDEITEEDALEFIDYNTIRALPYAGQYAPIIINDDVVLYETYKNLKTYMQDVAGEE